MAKRGVLLFSILFFLVMVLTELFSSASIFSPGKKKSPNKSQRSEAPLPRDLAKLHKALFAAQPKNKLAAAQALVSSGNESSIPYLIDALGDDTIFYGEGIYEDPGMYTVRYWAHEALLRLTGQNFNYRWDMPPSERDESILRWRTWAKSKS